MSNDSQLPSPPSPVSAVSMTTDELQRQADRRSVSDMASRELASRLLRGYTMLADECMIHNVPLVRAPPRPDQPKGETNPKECVICASSPPKSLPQPPPSTSTSYNKPEEPQVVSFTEQQPQKAVFHERAPTVSSDMNPVVSRDLVSRLENALSTSSDELAAATKSQPPNLARIAAASEAIAKLLVALGNARSYGGD